MIFLPVDEQLSIIRRGVEKIVPEEELAYKLTQSRETGKPLRVKYGIDPTGRYPSSAYLRVHRPPAPIECK